MTVENEGMDMLPDHFDSTLKTFTAVEASLRNKQSRGAMSLPRIRTDFNSNSLANSWTQEDIKRQGIELYEGMRAVFYDLDAEDGKCGYLHSEGTVWWDSGSKQFRLDMRTLQFRFTPGKDLNVLDALYPEK